MKALLSKEAGGPDTLKLTEIAQPSPAADEVRIAVHAVGINFPDLLIIEDRYQFKPQRPFAPGAEFAGFVDAVGAEVAEFSPGERVMALSLFGGLAEKVCISADRCHKIPEAVSFETAAALQMTYGTALYALRERGDLRAGEKLLVLGAAGGVGLAAVELGRALGAEVIAAASDEDKLEVAKAHGASDGVVYEKGPLDRDSQKAFSAALKDRLGNEGADVVVDTVGGDYTEPALRAVNWLGRFLVIGFPAGIAQIPANLPLLKSCDIRGVFWGAAVERDKAAHHRAMDQLLDMLTDGKIKPRIHGTYPLDKAGAAIAELSSRAVLGKVVVTLT